MYVSAGETTVEEGEEDMEIHFLNGSAIDPPNVSQGELVIVVHVSQLIMCVFLFVYFSFNWVGGFVLLLSCYV